jgi:serine/threonine-protein phosphatase 4 regulatory subunit 1
VTISACLTPEDREDKILSLLLELLKDDGDEETRILGLEILDNLAADLGTDICSNYLIFEIVSLADDPVYRVRKEVVRRIVNISKVVSDEVFIGVLLPIFKKLCTDHVWGVRHQAVEILP